MDAIDTRHDLFPPIGTYDHGRLAVGSGHELYWEQSGNPDGVPVLFLHGGPGAGTSPTHRRFLDPEFYRIVLFDQRGAGRSTPFADIRDNTTADLIADIEKLRERLGIDNWFLFGGSWGSLLAVAYGEAYPERCRGFVLRGVFLGRGHELTWFFDGMRNVYPEAWERFAGFLPADERADVLASYHACLVDPDPDRNRPAARAWNNFETECSTLLRDPSAAAPDGGARALALARIEAHYFVNRMFVDDLALLDNLHCIAEKPAIIVQGRYDMVCPAATAYELSEDWSIADLRIIPDAGHSALEPGIRSELVAATEEMKTLA